ncbi:MAG: hypothetical protein BGO78_02595 [Chloroflexi bacterium 44-23]|nr:MAG: hypothetical protein BGO78_02595 [Chloroflexi bacterium 44-23]
MFTRILVPLDGSELAEKVLPFTCYLAEKFQATLVLFHVVEKDAPKEIHGQHHLRHVDEARIYLNKVAENPACAGITIVQDVHEVQEEGVAQTIRDHAEELKTDLIVLCAHGNGGLRDVFFGSIAQQVIREGRIPVVFIRPETIKVLPINPIRHILLPLDGSKSHEDSIPIAATLAEKFHAKINLLTVVPTIETSPVRAALISRVSPRAAKLSLDISAQQAEKYLAAISEDLSDDGIAVSWKVLRGDVLAGLTETISVENIDLVVIATHGHSAIDVTWEGSLTPRFLPNAQIPVILLRGN